MIGLVTRSALLEQPGGHWVASEEDRLLATLLVCRGLPVRIVAWDDMGVDWSAFTLLVLRSTWAAAVLSSRLQRGLRLLPAAMLTALIVPQLLLSGATPTPAVTPRLIAGSIAALVAWRTRRVWVTVMVGMIVLWLLQWSGVPH